MSSRGACARRTPSEHAFEDVRQQRHERKQDPFEEAWLRAPVVADSTGATVGARHGRQVGDQVLRFAPESVFAGATVVVE